MQTFLQELRTIIPSEMASDLWLKVLRIAVVLVIGIILARLARSTFLRMAGQRLAPQHRMLFGRGIYYLVLGLAVVPALKAIGVDLTLFLGAAGLLTVAIGFASQAAASNLISGLFLVGEQPFAIGDVIRTGQTTGEVISIDLLSVKLRTFDNLLVRLPNETLLKSEITNLTRYPIRRLDLPIGVAYKEDLARVEEVLIRVADRNRTCLDEPRPMLILLGFGESSVDLQLSVWCERTQYLDFKSQMIREVKIALDNAGIEIPFPHRTLYTGAATDPMPVRLTTPRAEAEEGEGETRDVDETKGESEDETKVR